MLHDVHTVCCAAQDDADSVAALQTQLETVRQKQKDVQNELAGLSAANGLTGGAAPVVSVA